MSSATFYKWRAKYGGMGGSMARLKALEEENRRLKKIYADGRLTSTFDLGYKWGDNYCRWMRGAGDDAEMAKTTPMATNEKSKKL